MDVSLINLCESLLKWMSLSALEALISSKSGPKVDVFMIKLSENLCLGATGSLFLVNERAKGPSVSFHLSKMCVY